MRRCEAKVEKNERDDEQATKTRACVTLTKVKKDRSIFKQRGSTRWKIFRTRCAWIILYVSLHDYDVVSVR